MRRFGKWLGRFLLFIIVVIGGLWLLGPREHVDREITFDPSVLSGDLDAYLRDAEARFEDITPGVEKRIVWAGDAGSKTQLSLVYLHGFSATSEEIRPVPDRLAAQLGANLYYARLTGHGRDGDAMAEPSAGDWIEDTAEAIAIGREIGDRVIVIGTSTGGTLAALAGLDPALTEEVQGIVMISANFAIQNPAATILTWPLARHWLPLAVGPERSFEPINEGHATYWTTRYPTVSVLPMAALVKHVWNLDFSEAAVPALFMFSEQDLVVSPQANWEMSRRWGGPSTVEIRKMREGDDPFNHVIAGDILSPSQTDETVEVLNAWIEGLQ